MIKFYKPILIIVSIIIVIITGFRNYYLPFNHDEAATFFHFIQQGDFLPFVSQPDANNHILNSFFSFITFKFFGSSPFALRLPNFLALLVVLIAVFKTNKHLIETIPKFVLFAAFVVSFHWLSFFNISRGYGLSMAFLLLAVSFFIDYLKNPKTKSLVFLFLCLQLAVSANLTLLITTILLTLIVWYFQFRKNLFKKDNLLLSSVHLLFLLFWIHYSFYLKENNALYYGSGDNYFQSSFYSLFQLLSGYSSFALAVLSGIISGILIGYNLIRKKKSFFNTVIFQDFAFIFSLITLSLVIAFYLLNLIAGINFPEDRTGLFFYVFLVLSLAFTLDIKKNKIFIYTGLSIIILFIIHFISQLNFSRHSVTMYATMPNSFYHTLVSEQKKNLDEKITIGGHRMRELSYAFMNYRNEGLLNPMDPYESIELQYDYIVANKADTFKYNKLYKEIAHDLNHNFVLLKRIKELEKEIIYSASDERTLEGNHEYINLFEATEIQFDTNDILIAEIDFTILEAPVPFTSWIVFYGEGKDGSFYERIPLNWTRYDWNGKSANYNLITSKMNFEPYKIIIYIWNRKMEHLKVKVNQLKIYKLK